MPAFAKHPEIQQPLNTNSVVWRYLEHWKFEGMLKERALYFSALGDLDDKHEGSIPISDYQELLANSGNPDQWSLTRWTALQLVRVNCWTMQPGESDALWKIYARGSRSVAIRSTYSRLRDSVPTSTKPSLQIGVVQYKDFSTTPASGSRNMFAPVFWKRLPFRYESEVRVAGYFYSTEVHETPADFKPNPLVPCALDLLIETVVVSPYAGAAYRDEVEALVGSLSETRPPRVSKSELDTRPLF